MGRLRGIKSRYCELLFVRLTLFQRLKKDDEPVVPHRGIRLRVNPRKANRVLAAPLLPYVTEMDGRGLDGFFVGALQLVEGERLVGSEGVDVRARVEEASVVDCGAMVDDLMESVVFFRLRYVKDVDESVRAA